MNHSPIRLIALDLDGTVLDHEQRASPRVKRAIARAQERDIAVTIATGRGSTEARPFAESLGIRLPLICFQGGLVAEMDGRALHCVALDRRIAAEVVALAQSHAWHVTVFQDGHLYLTEQRHPYEFYRALLNPHLRVVPDLAEALDHDPAKVLIIADGNGDEILSELHAHFDGRAEIVRSHELFMEASPLGVDKSTGLAWLAHHLGIPQSQVMAIGDQDNDAPMVAWAGLGVAMGNGSESCKAVANWIAPPISEDGAAIAIERFALGEC